jgi:PAS domain S-box-containing protein/putative nucleotidyltransferase with HDIG domain
MDAAQSKGPSQPRDTPAKPSAETTREELVRQLELTRQRAAELERALAARTEVEERLSDTEQRYRLLVESIQEGLGIVDPDENIVFANQAYADILGCSHAELVGTNLRRFLADDEWSHVRSETGRRREGRTSVYELRVRRPDDQIRRIRVSAVPWTNGGGRFVGTIGAIVDVTAESAAQDALRDALVRLRRSVEGTVQATAALSEMRDPYTAGHQRRVAKLARTMARELGLGDEQAEGVYLSALTHDVGKISIPAEILAKPGRLLSVEFELIKTHAQLGHELLKGIDFPWPVADVALQHHERLDGSGYPAGLRDDAIRIESRIVSVADVVEAMATHRPYRPSLGLPAALEEVRTHRGTRFDASCVDACLELFASGRFSFD